jgi:hypothetical protein
MGAADRWAAARNRGISSMRGHQAYPSTMLRFCCCSYQACSNQIKNRPISRQSGAYALLLDVMPKWLA